MVEDAARKAHLLHGQAVDRLAGHGVRDDVLVEQEHARDPPARRDVELPDLHLSLHVVAVERAELERVLGPLHDRLAEVERVEDADPLAPVPGHAEPHRTQLHAARRSRRRTRWRSRCCCWACRASASRRWRTA